ncbi:unnamed protein product [Somion occarium]|uniref:Jacalin-type lectin domain-containing protein n=2 Tax=Somion occarium TaxID=3059160 RepID=A0ABP1DH45_9APHY
MSLFHAFTHHLSFYVRKAFQEPRYLTRGTGEFSTPESLTLQDCYIYRSSTESKFTTIFTMSGTITQTPLYGGNQGDAFNDMNISGWPATQTIDKISEIVVRHGGIVDNVTVTCTRTGGLAPETRSHGGTGGNATTVTLSDTEFLVGVYGQYGFVREDWGPCSIHKLQLVILDKARGSVRVEGPFSQGTGIVGTPFCVTGEVLALAGYDKESTARPQRYLQSLSFFGPSNDFD